MGRRGLLCIAILVCGLHALDHFLKRRSFFDSLPADVQRSIKSHVSELLDELEPQETRHLVQLLHARDDVQKLRILTRTQGLYGKVVKYTMRSIVRVRKYDALTMDVMFKAFLVLPELILRPQLTRTKVQVNELKAKFSRLQAHQKSQVREILDGAEGLTRSRIFSALAVL